MKPRFFYTTTSNLKPYGLPTLAEIPHYGMVTPRPDKPDKIVPDGARPKNGWFYVAPAPKVCRKLEGSGPDCAR